MSQDTKCAWAIYFIFHEHIRHQLIFVLSQWAAAPAVLFIVVAAVALNLVSRLRLVLSGVHLVAEATEAAGDW